MIKDILIVGLGSGIGGMIRFGIFQLFKQNSSATAFPFKTLVVNIIGCLIFGIAIGILEKYQIKNKEILIFLTMGICGGFTTFSSFANDNLILLKSGALLTSLLYIILSISLCIIACYVGRIIMLR